MRPQLYVNVSQLAIAIGITILGVEYFRTIRATVTDPKQAKKTVIEDISETLNKLGIPFLRY